MDCLPPTGWHQQHLVCLLLCFTRIWPGTLQEECAERVKGFECVLSSLYIAETIPGSTQRRQISSRPRHTKPNSWQNPKQRKQHLTRSQGGQLTPLSDNHLCIVSKDSQVVADSAIRAVSPSPSLPSPMPGNRKMVQLMLKATFHFSAVFDRMHSQLQTGLVFQFVYSTSFRDHQNWSITLKAFACPALHRTLLGPHPVREL